MATLHRFTKFAVVVSILTIVFNVVEGVVSVFFGAEGGSISLIFFGINSFVEVSSACLVLWRFLSEAKSAGGDESHLTSLDKERKATMGIGLLFILLAVGSITEAIISLIQHHQPSTVLSGLIITSISLGLMFFLYFAKRYLAKKLNSSTMASDALCTLSCLKITVVVFASSLLYMVWKGGWWVDSAATLVLGLLFFKEGIDMIISARSKDFNGGCCKGTVKEGGLSEKNVGGELAPVEKDTCVSDDCCHQQT
jgi:divalent metal cation (Fe/Co/Zn/Cd) transporter